ncbi:anaerobic sulfatase-maturating enzyme [Haloferula sargassicola]|uniref:Anaerobic sulfatase-maturating enzyme n=2 Tax=Haloferula sargassicola TaxID=490096 RepID=A0ABP9UTK5_9BACT
MFNKGDEAFRGMPRSVPWEVVEGVAGMIKDDHACNPTNDYSLVFHGGEPLLIGHDYFSRIMAYLTQELASIKVRYTIQTNGILIDSDWIHLFQKFNVVVGVSLDGPPNINGLNRKGFDGSDSTPRVLAGIAKLQESEVVFPGVLCVVQPEADGAETVEYFLNELGIEWFDLLLPDYTYEDIPDNWDDLQVRFGEFLISAFDAWFPHSRRGVSCRFFDSLLSKLTGGPSLVDTLGRDGLGAVIIETNGLLEPHDVLRICPEFARDTGIQVGAGALQRFRESASYRLASNLDGHHCNDCLTCDFFSVCKGGHYIHRYSRKGGFLNKSVHCKALTMVMNHVYDKLSHDTENIEANKTVLDNRLPAANSSISVTTARR